MQKNTFSKSCLLFSFTCYFSLKSSNLKENPMCSKFFPKRLMIWLYFSDEDPDNPTEYNSFGKDIKRISRAPSVVPSTSSALANSKPVATHVGFKELHGSSVNLTNKAANKKLPSNMIVEKHSRIRIANPTITQVGLDLSLMGRKMISMNRIRTAVIMKETDSDWTTVGVIFR